MARQRRKIGGAKNFKGWKEFSEGDFIVGEYISEGVDNTYGNPQYTIKVEEFELQDPSLYGDKTLVAGMELTLNSSGTYDSKMKELAKGTVVEIVYNGTEALPSTHKFKGRDAHQIDVFVLGDEEEIQEDDTGL
jgi:hypothetical protein